MGDNVSELGRTIAQLRAMGRVEPVDAAQLQMLRSMARELDSDPRNAALWRQYREGLKDLTSHDDSGSLDADLKALYATVRDSPPA